jgi:pyruvate/2-oxoglutarate dehydrogenase complex dihydrolipoamide dehydrogenase (E3) component
MDLENLDNTKKEHDSDALLYAIGRESNTDSLDFENTSIQINDRGYIKRDEFFETAAKGVYVVGNTGGVYMLQHAAAYEILGCHIIESSTMMHQVLTVMHINNDIRHLKEMLYIYPALSEALLPSVVAVVREIEKYNS